MFDSYKEKKEQFDKYISNYFNNNEFENILNYSIDNGKRIRPIILLEVYKMLTNDSDSEIIKKFALALEMIHNYSLIHDDLPSMDNDNYRRGRKTTHYKYGEDYAILAGDALLNYSYELMFEILLSNNNTNIIKACKYLANSSGYKGMILGQFNDIKGNIDNKELLINMYKNKTCKLIMAATTIPAYISNLEESEILEFEELGFCIGMAFQLQDDLIDITEDEDMDKVTYIKFVGREQTTIDINEYTNRAISILTKYDHNEFLIDLVKNMIKRQH